MQVSVIVPTLDEVGRITALLQDLQLSRSLGHEILLADGGSSDDTVAHAEPLVDRVVRSASGRALQMNAAAAVARGQILWFLHADSRVPANAAALINAACQSAECWGRFDVRLSGETWPFRIIERLMNLRSCLSGIATGDQGIFVRREAFDAAGGYPAIALMEDVALSKALRRRVAPACIRSPRLQTSSRRWEQRGILRTVVLMWQLRLRYALGASPEILARRYR